MNFAYVGLDAAARRVPSWILELAITLDRSVLAFAGVMILVSLALTLWVSPYWLWFTAFIGANLIQSSFTGFCPAASIFRLFGIRGGCAFE